jgi:hypothetical protein
MTWVSKLEAETSQISDMLTTQRFCFAMSILHLISLVHVPSEALIEPKYLKSVTFSKFVPTSMRIFLHRVDAAGNNVGLKLNAKKTKVMHITGPGSQGPQQIRIIGTNLEKCFCLQF